MVRIELDVPAVDAAFDSVSRDFQRNASLPGFRPGKAPRDLVARRYAAEIETEVKKKLMGDAYRQALKEQSIEVVGPPDIEEIQFGRGQAMQFAATIETAPAFDLPEYRGLPAKRETAKTTEADVDRALTLLRERKQDFQTVDRELREGDIAVVNYSGSCEGKPISDTAPAARGLTEQKGFWINADKTSFIPGFSEQLYGAKAGDKRTVNVDFPADFVTPQLAGKKGVFETELAEVKTRVFPELNDEFAKGYGAESMEKLREGVRTDLQNELNFKQDRDLRTQVVKALLDNVRCELPESVVHQETRNVVYNIVSENQRRGVAKELIEEQKNEIYSAASTTARDRVKAGFIFGKIAEKEGIKAEQNEVLQRIQQLAQQYEMTVDKFIKELQKRDGIPEIYEQIVNEKVIDFLVKNAKVEEVAPAPTAPAPA